MLVVYSDASYNQPSSTQPKPLLLHTVGGYVADVKSWKKFRADWNKELELKGMDHFHMNKFEYAQHAVRSKKPISQKSPYYGWRQEDFVPFLKRLHRIINQKRRDGSFRLEAFISSLVGPDFDAVLPDELQDSPGCASHYIFNVAVNMESIAMWADRRGYHGPIHYVFAGGDGEGGNLERWFDRLWKSNNAKRRFRLSKGYTRMGYDVQWMKQEPALQAADIAAFEFCKAALKHAEKGGGPQPDLRELRKSLANLCQTRHNGKLLTRERLVLSFKQMAEFRKKYGTEFVD